MSWIAWKMKQHRRIVYKNKTRNIKKMKKMGKKKFVRNVFVCFGFVRINFFTEIVD